ncbi:acyl-CoA dehydrogenase family protein [Streptomyces sp. NPDC008121]|uniref:acyl-CoA dehydrogenase family protein n=1 Tax=Streptomyces sp. NPDC008121 TaxID=3364809 RepID=UPI0036E3417D
MDFTPTEEQAAAAGLAARIFGDLATHERLAAAGTGSDAELWKALCAAGLPEAVEETGLLGLVLLAEEQGRTTAQTPFTASCVYGLLAVARHGTDEQRARLLPGLRDGTTVVTGAFPATGAVRAGPDGRLSGEVGWVPWLRDATHVLVPDGERTLWLVPVTEATGGVGVVSRACATGGAGVVSRACATDGAGATGGAGVVSRAGATGEAAEGRRTAEVTVTPVQLTAPWAAGRLVLDGARAERLGDPSGRAPASSSATSGPSRLGPPSAYDDVLTMARIAFAGLQAGVCAGSLARAVAYTSVREQFGRPLATRQAVQLRAADAHMDTEAIRVTAYEAAWLHDHDQGRHHRQSAAEQALTAAWWASEAGKRVVHAGQHLHGGMGADLDHPVHRHFLWGRQLDAYLGCGTELLAELGDLLANGEPT